MGVGIDLFSCYYDAFDIVGSYRISAEAANLEPSERAGNRYQLLAERIVIRFIPASAGNTYRENS